MNATSVVMREWRRAQTAQAARANQAEALRQERDAAQLDATQARERAAELAGELAQAGVHIGQRLQVVHGEADVRDADGRVFDEARRAAAGTLEAGVMHQHDEAGFGQTLGIDVAGSLLFATADWVCADDSGILLAFVKAGRQVDVGRSFPAQVLVGDGLDVVHGWLLVW